MKGWGVGVRGAEEEVEGGGVREGWVCRGVRGVEDGVEEWKGGGGN